MAEEKKPVAPGGFADMTPQERAEFGRRGGIKSGEVRRNRKNMRETLGVLLDMNMKSGKGCNIDAVQNFAALKGKNVTLETALLLAQIQKALKGDTTAFTAIRDTSGQNPGEKIDISGAVPVVISGEDELTD